MKYSFLRRPSNDARAGSYSLLVVALSGFSFGCSAPDSHAATADKKNEPEKSLSGVRQTCEASRVGPPILARLTRSQTEETLRDVFGLENWDGVRLSADSLSKLGFTNDASELVVGAETASSLLKTAEDVAGLVVANLDRLLPCASSTADESCVEEYLEKYGYRLFRRPLTDAEKSLYTTYHASVAARADFATGIRWMTVALIQSPHAIYRSEIGTPSNDGRALDNYELATQMAYMLTNSTPDQALLARAAAGELTDPAVRRQEGERLLSEDGSRHFLDGIRGFFEEWLSYRRALGMSRDDNPLFAQEVSPAMVEETRAYLDVVYGYFGTFRDLMTADYSFHNQKLSAFYGWGNAAGEGFVQVKRPPEQGLGILAQGSLLVATSHQAATSPTLRGKFFTNRFLCVETPKPPPFIPTIEESNRNNPGNTTREKYEFVHESSFECSRCHKHFEPWGYTFESFDEMGLRRFVEVTDKGEFPIDTAVDDAPMPDGSVASFASLDDVVSLVDSSTLMQDCFSGLLTAYMFSGAGGTNCLAEDARRAFAAGELSIYDYLLELLEAPHFGQRK